jgi:hypothetical protein
LIDLMFVTSASTIALVLFKDDMSKGHQVSDSRRRTHWLSTLISNI